MSGGRPFVVEQCVTMDMTYGITLADYRKAEASMSRPLTQGTRVPRGPSSDSVIRVGVLAEIGSPKPRR